MISPPVNRRRFLIWLIRGSLAATAGLVIGQMLRFLSFQPPNEDVPVIPVGQPEDFPNGGAVYVKEARVFVGHDATGLYALDAECPHLGCLLEQGKEDGFSCPCHGSRFDAEGGVKAGPATKPLRYLHLALDEEGQLIVDRTRRVEPATRLTL